MILLSKLVNSGESFQGKYFVQTCNINLKDVEWTPIGVYNSNNYFYGTYDGNGHYIEELNINGNENSGFFGVLGGTVMNFGIESGRIQGACVGGISSHSASSSALILNCYSKVTVYGDRAGGIVDNFNGTVINCWSNCELHSDTIGGISSYGLYNALYCYSTKAPLSPNMSNYKNSNGIEIEYLNSKEFANKLSNNIYIVSSMYDYDYTKLNRWIIDGNGLLKLSSEKMSLTLSDIPIYIYSHRMIIYPIILSSICISILAYMLFNKNNVNL